jgi:hypothetical protein
MAVTRISQSSLKQGLKKNKNFVAGIPPITGKYYLMGSVTVGAGGASSIEFTDIPPVYRHLQLRVIANHSNGANVQSGQMFFNGDEAGNYGAHYLVGSGAAALAGGAASTVAPNAMTIAPSTSANVFGASVIDILDYANTSKNTTWRALTGADINGGTGYLQLFSAVWLNTASVTSLKLKYGANNLGQHSTAAIYGIGTAAQ